MPEPVPLSECIADLRDFLLERWENEASPNGAPTPPGSDRRSFDDNERG